MQTPFTARLGITLPIVQAPMAGVSTAALAGAVSAAGGLGSIAVGAMGPEAADEAVREALAATRGCLNVNLFVHRRPRRNPAREAAWLECLAPHFERFGHTPPARLEEIYPTLDDAPELVEVMCTRRPPVISLHFGLPAPATLRALRETGACLMATATSPGEARRLEAAGIDVIVLQGFEAGGHRGCFEGPDAALPTADLLEATAATLGVPVLAAGGISDGRGIADALARGAAGAQLGTLFIECPESAAGSDYRHALRAADRTTAMTAVFSGRPARGLVNDFIRELGTLEDRVPDYPVAYDAAKRLATAAAGAGVEGFSVMWAGSGPARTAPLPATELMRALEAELGA